LPASQLKEDEQCPWFFDCCTSRGGTNKEEIEQKNLYREFDKQNYEIKDLFPMNFQMNQPDMSISLSVEICDSLCPSFLQNDFPILDTENTPQWNCEEFNPEFYDLTNNFSQNGSCNCFNKNNPVYPCEGVCEEILQTSANSSHIYAPNKRPKNKKFTPEEDAILLDLVKQYGEGCWSKIAEKMGDRNRKQVRDRYQNFLKPDKNVQFFSPEEDSKILALVAEHGKQWNLIAKNLPGRNPHQIKSRYYAKIKNPKIELSKNPQKSENGISTLVKTRAFSVETQTLVSPICEKLSPRIEISEKSLDNKPNEENKKIEENIVKQPVKKCIELLKEQQEKFKGVLINVIEMINRIKIGKTSIKESN